MAVFTFHTSMLFTQMLFLGDDVLWCSQEGLMQEASEAVYQTVSEQAPLACPLQQHHFTQPGDAVL